MEPRICASLTGRTTREQAEAAKEALSAGADLVEFRLDHLSHPGVDDISADLAEFSHRAVLTARSDAEGGRFPGPEEERLSLITSLAGLRPAFMDVELATLASDPALRRDLSGIPLIISWHDMRKTPKSRRLRLAERRARSLRGIPKIVSMARSPSDNLEILSLYGGRAPPIAFCMGESGLLSRIMALELGSPVGYASFGNGVAPGQLPLKTMLALRRRLQDG